MIQIRDAADRTALRRRLKKSGRLTRPTLARRDMLCPKQGRRLVETEGVSSGYVEDFDEPRTKLANIFSPLPDHP